MNEASRRVLRAEKEIRQIVGSYLLTGFKDPIQGLPSVTRVMVSGDMRSARVYLSFLRPQGEAVENNENKKTDEAALETVSRRASDIQRQIASQLPMKFCPRLQFFLDTSAEKTMRVERLLRQVAQESAADSLVGEAMESTTE